MLRELRKFEEWFNAWCQSRDNRVVQELDIVAQKRTNYYYFTVLNMSTKQNVSSKKKMNFEL